MWLLVHQENGAVFILHIIDIWSESPSGIQGQMSEYEVEYFIGSWCCTVHRVHRYGRVSVHLSQIFNGKKKLRFCFDVQRAERSTFQDTVSTFYQLLTNVYQNRSFVYQNSLHCFFFLVSESWLSAQCSISFLFTDMKLSTLLVMRSKTKEKIYFDFGAQWLRLCSADPRWPHVSNELPRVFTLPANDWERNLKTSTLFTEHKQTQNH